MPRQYNTCRIFLLFGATLICLGAFAQNDHKALLEGNEAYENGNYSAAEEEYMRAIEADPNSVKGHYNRGNAIYKGTSPSADPEARKERLGKAADSYLSAIANATDDKVKARAYHNLGNTYMEMQDLENGIESYKNALRLNPEDMDTKTNLQQALMQLRMQQQQQQQQSGEGGKDEGEPQEGEPQPNESDEQDEPRDNPQEQEGEQERERQQQNEDSQAGRESGKEERGDPKEMSKEEVLRQLKVMDEEEKKVLEKLRKDAGGEYPSDKDW